jgi:hypothetical protein
MNFQTKLKFKLRASVPDLTISQHGYTVKASNKSRRQLSPKVFVMVDSS